MEEYFWLFTIVGGTLLLGVVIGYGVLRQRRLSAGEQHSQERRVRELYDREQAGDRVPASGPQERMSKQARTGPLFWAVVFISIACAFGYYVGTQPSTEGASVEGKEQKNAQPAGPADEGALPGQN